MKACGVVILLLFLAGEQPFQQAGFTMVFCDIDSGNIAGQPANIGSVEPVVITAYVPVPVDQDELFGVDEIVGAAIAFGNGYIKLVPGYVVDLFFITGKQPPVVRVNAEFIGICFNGTHRIPFRIYGEGEDLYQRIVFHERLLQHFKVGGQFGADSRAGSKEKIHHYHLAFKIAEFYLLTKLVGKSEIAYGMPYSIICRLTVFKNSIHTFRYIIPGYGYDIFTVMIYYQVPCQRN